jgi:hypothetical protein
MRQGSGQRRLWLAAPLLALVLGGCDLTGYDDDVDGFYSYAGTVYDAPGYSVNGTLNIDQRNRRDAWADVEWFMLEGSRTILEVEDWDVPVTVDSNGRVRFVVIGEMQLSDGGWVDFRLEHDGRVSGRTMRGNWELITDLPSTDRGTFSASR